MLHKWDYESPFVRDRLDASLRFVQRFVPPEFDGIFVEIGAYNGDFTRRLLGAFPSAGVAASDISDAAWPPAFPVQLQTADMLSVTTPPECATRPTILLMLECLYYLPQKERELAVHRLVTMLPVLQWAFVSGPLSDPVRYFDESWLVATFADAGLALSDLSPLNTNSAFISQFSWNEDWVINLLPHLSPVLGDRYRRLQSVRAEKLNRLEAKARKRLATDAAYRKKYAHQVIYAFNKTHPR